MCDYVINDKTLAIIPFGKKSALVYEDEKIFIVNNTAKKIIIFNCLINGSSYEGRLKSTEMLTGYTYKAPIILKEDEELIFFPTTSPRQNDCIWLNLNTISKVKYNLDSRLTNVLFSNNVNICLNTSINILNNQINRSLRLRIKLHQYKKKYV